MYAQLLDIVGRSSINRVERPIVLPYDKRMVSEHENGNRIRALFWVKRGFLNKKGIEDIVS